MGVVELRDRVDRDDSEVREDSFLDMATLVVVLGGPPIREEVREEVRWCIAGRVEMDIGFEADPPPKLGALRWTIIEVLVGPAVNRESSFKSNLLLSGDRASSGIEGRRVSSCESEGCSDCDWS